MRGLWLGSGPSAGAAWDNRFRHGVCRRDQSVMVGRATGVITGLVGRHSVGRSVCMDRVARRDADHGAEFLAPADGAALVSDPEVCRECRECDAGAGRRFTALRDYGRRRGASKRAGHCGASR